MEFAFKSALKFVMKFVMIKNIKKIMVSQNLHQARLLEVGLTKIPGDHDSPPCRLFI